MRKAKYLVVGGGLAGATCAYLLKKAGQDVLLVERFKLETKAKLCGGLMTPRSLDLLESIYGPESGSLFSQDYKSFHCVTEKYDVVINKVRMRSLPREVLDNYALARYQELGGEVVDACNIRSIDFSGKFARGIRNGSPCCFMYDTLIAADGAMSTVRKELEGAYPDTILTLETEVPKSSDEVVMLFSSSLNGYAWYIPHGELANIGCGSFGGCSDLDGELKAFAERMGVSYESRKGAFLPTGASILLHKGSVYFLGDAAGLICPPSGEGIYYALESARVLARCLISSASYNAGMAKHVQEVTKQLKTRDLFYNKRFMDSSLAMAGATPYGRERAVKFALRNFAGFDV